MGSTICSTGLVVCRDESGSEANGLEQSLTADQLCGNRSKEAKHRQTAVQFFGTLVESPTRIRASHLHGRFNGVEVVMPFQIVSHQSGGCFHGGCCHGCFQLGPDRSMSGD